MVKISLSEPLSGKPSEFEELEFPDNLVKYSAVLQDQILIQAEMGNVDNKIPLIGIKKDVLEKIIKMCEYHDDVGLTEDKLASATFKSYPEKYKEFCGTTSQSSYAELLRIADMLDIAFIRIILYKYLIFMMYIVNPRTLFGMPPLKEEQIKKMTKEVKWFCVNNQARTF